MVWEVANWLGEGVGSLWGVARPSVVELVDPLWVEAVSLQVGPALLSWEEALLSWEEAPLWRRE